MQFLSFYKPKTPMSGPPSAEHMAQMNEFASEMTSRGHLIASGGFLDPSQTFTLSLSGGRYALNERAGSAADGFGGFGLLQASSRDEMIELLKRFLEVAGDGECVVRPLMDPPPVK